MRPPYGRRRHTVLRTLPVCGAAATIAAVTVFLTTAPAPDGPPTAPTDGRAPGPAHQVRVDRLEHARPALR